MVPLIRPPIMSLCRFAFRRTPRLRSLLNHLAIMTRAFMDRPQRAGRPAWPASRSWFHTDECADCGSGRGRYARSLLANIKGIRAALFSAALGGTLKPVLYAILRPRSIFLRCTCSVSALASSDDRRLVSISLMVMKTTRASTPSDALRMYHSSNLSLSSLETSLPPFTCAQPVMPGRTASLIDAAEG